MRLIWGLLAGGFAVLGFCLWFYVASNYDYGMLAGVYRFHTSDLSCTLTLHSDRSFDQDCVSATETRHAEGGWRRIGEGGVNFSEQFLRLPGQMNGLDQLPEYPHDAGARTYYGHFDKILTLYPVLYLDAKPSDLRLTKAFLR